MNTSDESALLEVRDLRVGFAGAGGVVDVVRGLDFDIVRREIVAIVGESGSGKTVSSLALMGLLPRDAAISGSAVLDGQRLLGASSRRLRELRSARIAMVFQDPMTALNPVRTVGSQLIEVARAHQRLGRREARSKAIAALQQAQLPQAEQRMSAHIHELSGGLRQRVMIAMALINDPQLIIADEPTTALDVTVQAQILEMLLEIREQTSTSLLLITHDLGLVSSFADRVLVMYAGRIVEQSPVRSLFDHPSMPYTAGLLASLPSTAARGLLRPIPGTPPQMARLPSGCPFHPRCPFIIASCKDLEPELLAVADDLRQHEFEHRSACHRRDLVRKMDDPRRVFTSATGT